MVKGGVWACQRLSSTNWFIIRICPRPFPANRFIIRSLLLYWESEYGGWDGYYFWLEFNDKFVTSWTWICRPNGLQLHEVTVLLCIHQACAILFIKYLSLACECCLHHPHSCNMYAMHFSPSKQSPSTMSAHTLIWPGPNVGCKKGKLHNFSVQQICHFMRGT